MSRSGRDVASRGGELKTLCILSTFRRLQAGRAATPNIIRASQHAGLHARTAASMPVCALCTHAYRQARMHVPRGAMHNGIHACKDACTLAASSPGLQSGARACAGFETGVHPCCFTAHVRSSVLAIRLPLTCWACFLSCCIQSDRREWVESS